MRRSRTYPAWKQGLDLVFTLVVIPLIIPVGLICAAAIWLDSPGQVLFAQPRAGHNGRVFRMYKFRTMVPNAAELKAGLAHLNVLPPPDFKIPNDPRITRVGRVLRRTSLDELPQFINILLGDMSVVGPRPTSFLPDTYSLWHTERLEVKPGLTGLWQIDGRGSSTFDQRLRMDVTYIRTMSVRTDLRIIAKTIGEIVKRSGA